jgi:hypothetical protein
VKELLARLPPGSIVDALELQFALRILYRGREKSRVWTPSDMHPGELIVAFYNGARAAQTIADGGAPNLDALAAGAEALAEIHLRFSRGTADFAWIKPTEDDVQNARHLAALVRQGAPSPALVEPARRAVRVATDSEALARFQRILVCLEDETWGWCSSSAAFALPASLQRPWTWPARAAFGRSWPRTEPRRWPSACV